MRIIENNGSVLRNNRRMFWEILNRIMGRKNRIIGTGLHLTKCGDTYADWDPTSRSDAQQVLASIISFEFIVFLTVYQFMSHLAGITFQLQRSALDIVEAHEMITEINSSLTSFFPSTNLAQMARCSTLWEVTSSAKIV